MDLLCWGCSLRFIAVVCWDLLGLCVTFGGLFAFGLCLFCVCSFACWTIGLYVCIVCFTADFLWLVKAALLLD